MRSSRMPFCLVSEQITDDLPVRYFYFFHGVWVQGDELEGWASMPYETLESCLNAVSRAEAIQKDLLLVNPKAHPKYFECQEVTE